MNWIERRVIIKLVAEMTKAGWEVIYVNDGEENEEAKSIDDILAVVDSVDEAWIYFHKMLTPNLGATHWVQIVLGNDGYDCIADYSFGLREDDDFSSVMIRQVDPYIEKLEEDYRDTQRA